MKDNRIVTLPVGLEIREESKRDRRSFAIKPSVLEEFKRIADREGTNVNALLNEILEDFVRKAAKKWLESTTIFRLDARHANQGI